MKGLIVLFLLFQTGLPGLSVRIEVRELYYRASVEQAAVDELVNKLKSLGNSEPVWIGYMGMANMLKAKYAINPYKKLSHFHEGKSMLEEAISKAPRNVELRFLRLSVQLNAPAFLNYHNRQAEDLSTMLANWDRLKDEDLKKRVREFVFSSSLDSPKVRRRLLQ